MRILRAKGNKRHLRLLKLVYGFSPPFKVLVDGNFLHAALSSSVDIHAGFSRAVLDAPCHAYVTPCVLKELEALGAATADALAHARTLRLHRCGHSSGGGGGGGGGGKRRKAGTEDAAEEEAEEEEKEEEEKEEGVLNASVCLARIIGRHNREKFFVATQDNDLRIRCRSVPGCPLVTLNRTVVSLEPVSAASRAKVATVESAKAGASARHDVHELKVSKKRSTVGAAALAVASGRPGAGAGAGAGSGAGAGAGAGAGSAAGAPAPKKRRKKGPKQPNPLSIKKKKSKTTEGAGAKKKKNRRRKAKKEDA